MENSKPNNLTEAKIALKTISDIYESDMTFVNYQKVQRAKEGVEKYAS